MHDHGNPADGLHRRQFLAGSGVGMGVATFSMLGVGTSRSEAKDQPTRVNKMPKKDWHTEQFRKMVALGESTTAGGWATSVERCWVSVLADLINDVQPQTMEFFNAGIGGNVISTRSPCYAYDGTKPAANERLDKHVFAH